MYKKISGVFFCCLLFIPLSALDPQSLLTQYARQSWDDRQGLPQNSVLSIAQTADGYLWLGTEEGLVRFDGIRFTPFDKTNTPQIKDNYIRKLFPDSRGNLWIGIRDGGLVLYRQGRFKSFGQAEGLTHSTVNAITEDDRHNLWVGTDGGGLFVLEGNRFKVYTTAQGLPHNTIRSLYTDSRGTLWIGTIKGVCSFKEEKFQPVAVAGAQEFHINALCEDSRGNFWIGAYEGLFKKEPGKALFSRLDPGKADFKVYAVLEDRDHNLWIGTTAQGLFRYRDGQFAAMTKNEGLPDSAITSIAEDREGSLWIGTAYGGLARLGDEKFKTFTTMEGLTDNLVFSVFADRAGHIWIGTGNGLDRLEDGRFSHFSTQNGLCHNSISGMTEDASGRLWVCTDDGVNHFRGDGPGLAAVEQYLRRSYWLAALEDSAGTVWAGSISGLFHRPKDRETFGQVKDFPAGPVNLIFEDSRKNLWFSVYRQGLVCRRAGQFTLYNTGKGLASDSVNCIYEDKQATLWIGTINGLCRLKDNRFSQCTESQGLFNNNIYQVLEDDDGNFWMSCNKGIFTVKKRALNDLCDQKTAAVVSRVFNKEDGMKTNECNGGYQAAGCKDKNGRLWFPTSKGVATIDPAAIKTNDIKPPVYIETILLDGQPIDFGNQIKIKPGVKRIEFHYTAPSFIDPGRVKFKCRLTGYDDRWVDADKSRMIAYTNLDSGDYRFSVTACNNDGLWNEAGAAVNLVVIPPLWKTWWFTLVSLVCFALVSNLLIQFFRRYITLSQFWKKQKYVGQFKLIDKIGEGGMGTIYKAVNQNDKTNTVAIKVLKDELFKDENSQKRFKQEAAIIDQLDHPNIVKVYERGQSKQNMFIAMELLSGRTLAHKIKEEKQIDMRQGLDIMLQIADALARIHHKNIVHRDLKPENIMLIRKGDNPNFVKLLDFGLARMEHQTRLTQTGMVVGTLTYMAPEQVSGSKFSFASDVYSLGILFYEMVTGQHPFVGETTIDLMKQILDRTPSHPSEYNTGIPGDLNLLIMQMLAKKEAGRPTASDVLARLTILQVEHLSRLD